MISCMKYPLMFFVSQLRNFQQISPRKKSADTFRNQNLKYLTNIYNKLSLLTFKAYRLTDYIKWMTLSWFYMKTLLSCQRSADYSPDLFPAGRFFRGHLTEKFHQILSFYYWFLLTILVVCVCFITCHCFSSKIESYVISRDWINTDECRIHLRRLFLLKRCPPHT